MGQTVTFAELPQGRKTIGTSETTVAGTGLTTIAQIYAQGCKLLTFHFAPATQAIDDLQVYVRGHASAEYVDITPTSATWATITTPGWRFKQAAVSTTSTGAYVDADLNTVAVTENGFFELDVTNLYDVLVKASAASDSAVVTAYWSLS